MKILLLTVLERNMGVAGMGQPRAQIFVNIIGSRQIVVSQINASEFVIARVLAL